MSDRDVFELRRKVRELEIETEKFAIWRMGVEAYLAKVAKALNKGCICKARIDLLDLNIDGLK